MPGIQSGLGLRLSGSRLALSLILIFLGCLSAWGSLTVIRHPARFEQFWKAPHRQRIVFIGLALFLLLAILGLLPSYRFPSSLAGYVDVLRPLFFWLAFAGAAILFLLGAEPARDRALPNLRGGHLAIFAFAVLLLLWLVIAVTGLGIRFREDYWYGAGVPALPLQVLVALVMGLLVARWESAGRKMPRLDVALFLGIWALAALLWAFQPLRASFFLPGPFRPTGDFYPSSDAMGFDMGGQLALIGQGIQNGEIFDRALYMAFSAYLHAIAGQNFVRMLGVQAAIFAVLPSILYLLGRELHSRPLGVSMAALAALRGVNSIAAATWIDLANPKMPLTDFPTAIGLALFTLFLVRWLKRSGHDWPSALWAGAALGFTAMLRTHVLLLAPLVVATALTVFRKNWRRWLLGGALLLLGMFSATLPWDLRNQSKGAPPFALYFERIQMVLRARYNWPPAGTWDPGTQGSHLSSAARAGGLAFSHNRIAFAQLASGCPSLPCRIANHFLHNLVTSVLFLPASPVLDNLHYTVKESLPYWQQDWIGQRVSLAAALSLLLNLGLIALGIGVAWQRGKWPAMIPLFIYTGYMASNALAQTSGGRYIVPVDWVVTLYFLLGALAVVGWIFVRLDLAWLMVADLPSNPAGELRATASKPAGILLRGLPIMVIILLIGSLLPLAEVIFPRRYAASPDTAASLARLEAQGSLEKLDLSSIELRAFLSQPGAGLWAGRVLYPRYYDIGRGEISNGFPFDVREYPRMTFALIGPTGWQGVILPGPIRGRFEHAVDGLVLGCYTAISQNDLNGRIDALAVILPEKRGTVYVRWPEAEWKCPAPEPVCIDRETCR
jgi:hypothetical protein